MSRVEAGPGSLKDDVPGAARTAGVSPGSPFLALTASKGMGYACLMKAETTVSDAQLLAEFVASFEKFDALYEFKDISPEAWQFRVGRTDWDGGFSWRPRAVSTDRPALEPLYQKLPGRFPSLYEELVLNYRWAEVDLGRFRLLANPLGPDLCDLESEIFRDPGLIESLLPAGLVPFGKGPDVDYDPVCFQLAGTTPDRARIVKVDHEEILCRWKVVIVGELAANFRELVEETIERARAAPPLPSPL